MQRARNRAKKKTDAREKNNTEIKINAYQNWYRKVSQCMKSTTKDCLDKLVKLIARGRELESDPDLGPDIAAAIRRMIRLMEGKTKTMTQDMVDDANEKSGKKRSGSGKKRSGSGYQELKF
jgi:hypothetical protein